MLLTLGFTCVGADTNAPNESAAAYTHTINQRAEKIVATLGIEDSAKSARVRDLIAQQYRDLSDIHAARDAQIKTAKQQNTSTNQAATDAGSKGFPDLAKAKLDRLHFKFLAKLSEELSTEQVDKVKDGLTYGMVPLTYGVYLKMYLDLTDAQKKQIMAWLIEARELAMNEGSSKEKHAVFGKYKGRINNYLSAAGYDAKKAGKDWAARRKAVSDEKPTKKD